MAAHDLIARASSWSTGADLASLGLTSAAGMPWLIGCRWAAAVSGAELATSIRILSAVDVAPDVVSVGGSGGENEQCGHCSDGDPHVSQHVPSPSTANWSTRHAPSACRCTSAVIDRRPPGVLSAS